MRAFQRWLCRTQIDDPARRRKQQLGRLQELLLHAYNTVPFYRDRLGRGNFDPATPLSMERWQRIPLLSRRDIQTAGRSIHSSDVPREHGAVFTTFTGGSTGQPVMTLGTRRTSFYWQAITLRDHFWQGREFSKKLAAIRHIRRDAAPPPDGKTGRNWGPSVSPFVRTGPGVLLSTDSTTEEQATWLLQHRPSYLLGYPSCILALANWYCATQNALPELKQVRTFGEIVEPQVRSACREAWNSCVADVYSTQELGYLALQCPESECYHVQEENVLVELLRDDGTPCEVGEIGKVVVTSLHNFAMPLLRYDIGDYAELGDSCACGRTLMVLKRILGRQRNMLLLPDGSRRWPSLHFADSMRDLGQVMAIQQMQVVQKSFEEIDVNLVVPQRLAVEAEDGIRRLMQRALAHPFRVCFHYVAEIPRSPSGKFEDFRCDVDAI